MILKKIDKSLDYGMTKFNKVNRRKEKEEKEVPDGLIGRAMMNDTEAIQKKLRNQINKIIIKYGQFINTLEVKEEKIENTK
jgi:hypothetical protein